jgi:hypothetical protein
MYLKADQTQTQIHLFCRSVVLRSLRHRVAQVVEAEDMHLHTGNHSDPSARHLYKMEDRLAKTKSRSTPRIDCIRLHHTHSQVL